MTSDADYVGRSQTREDRAWPRLAEGLEATLDLDPGTLTAGGILPPLWHWMLFQDWVPARAVGADGHPKRGGFLPRLADLPRRMWAGGRVGFHGDLKIGEAVSRTSTILKIEEKKGGSGRLVFVTLRHEISGAAGLAVSEEQDLVYRPADTGTAAPAKTEAASPLPPAAAIRTLTPDPVMLFRFSALTGNGHRIHYDRAYAENEENYPGLVVHGPLQAILLADQFRRTWPGRALRTFTFRGRKPAFAGQPLALVASEADGKVTLETRDAGGAVCMAATAA